MYWRIRWEADDNGESHRTLVVYKETQHVSKLDPLHNEWTDASSKADSHVHSLLAPLPANATLVTVIDAHPASLSWLGCVHGHRTMPLGVTRFGQSGDLVDLYEHYGIDQRSIERAAAEGLAAAAAAARTAE